MLYLDYLASTPLLPQVQKDMQKAWEETYANPSSNHTCGLKAAELIDQCKETIADEIGAYPSEIIFTSGATEANNFAIKGLAFALGKTNKHIVTSAIEHKCVLEICSFLETQGFEVTYVKPTADGIVTTEAVAAAIRPDTILVSIMHVNNELGTINPIQEIGELCLEKDIAFHTDAAQSFKKLPIDVLDMNLHAMSVSAHKFGGPKGIGFCFLRDAKTTTVEPLIHGAGQQMGLRGGTVATPLIVGLNSAVQNYQYDEALYKVIKVDLIKQLQSSGTCFKINGINALPNVMNLRFFDSKMVNDILSSQKYCVSQGSACSSKEITPSHVLQAIGLNAPEARNCIRLSFSDESVINLFKDFELKDTYVNAAYTT
ncbi:cysteine desulfurase family protein [Paraferrimonas sedimenticola]|uniref:cysteine desulfurase n=1 Tax=Paraferrimonas sedimenticola TaxID=375674 RepID=A0AA37RXQ9_9GAMM|nr:cysteine desulfurase family protein [Paraferrimonas sedimenticola]GLP96998.1 cysteine desulfurase NifS [Paraferrimonas sedimenticola]